MKNHALTSDIGSIVISLDMELAWGRIERDDRFLYYSLLENTRNVINRLLALFDKYDVPVTWAVVGRLIEKRDNHAEPLSAFYANVDEKELYADQIRNSIENSWLEFPDLIEMIKSHSAKHEIGSHTYSHILFGDWLDEKGVNRELAQLDFAAAQNVWEKHGLRPRSIIYPRNAIGYVEVLRNYGFDVFRSKNLSRYSSLPGFLQKICNAIELFLPVSPLTSPAMSTKDGLIDLPGSMHFKVMHWTYRKYVPFGILRRKAILGLKRASRRKEVFHLWFHPFDFGHCTEEHFAVFESVLSFAADLRGKNKIKINVMGDFIPK